MKDIHIQAIGLMSGTSLDGLDVCCCTFRREAEKWNFHIDYAKGYAYPDDLKQKLGSGAGRCCLRYNDSLMSLNNH